LNRHWLAAASRGSGLVSFANCPRLRHEANIRLRCPRVHVLAAIEAVVERGIRDREKRATRRLFGYRAKIESWTSGSEIGKSQSV
jgi:hypothetical protein